MEKLLSILIFLSTVIASQAQTVHLTQTSLTAEPGQYHFDRPRAVVYDGEENVTSQFYLNYYIKGQENDTSTYENKIVTQNPVTGTRISMLYGIVHIGTNAGNDTIRVVARPRTGSTYSQCEAFYVIHIPKFQPTVVLSQDSVHVHTSQLFGYPTARLYRIDGIDSTDVTSYYNVTYNHSDALKDFSAAFTGVPGSNNILLAPSTITSGMTITMTYTPKDDYADVYEPYTKTFNVTMYTWQEGEAMPTHLDWPNGKTIEAQNSAQSPIIMPVIRDIYGNDVSRLMVYDYSPKQIAQYVNNVWSSSNGVYGSWIIQFGYQVNGSTKIQMTAQQATESKNTDPVTYAAISDSINIQEHKAKWTFTVTPSTFRLFRNTPILNRFNWSLPTFNVKNPQGETTTGGFQRRVAFPEGTFSGNDNGSATGDTITFRGIKYIVRVAENYTFQQAYGDWQIDYTHVYDTLVAHNAPFVIFTIYPWNAGQEDVQQDYTGYDVDVTDVINTRIVLSANVVSANVVKNSSGNTLKGFHAPTATIRDANGINVTDDFDLTYTIISDSSTVANDFTIDNTGALSYNSNASGKDGNLYVRVSAKAKTRTSGFNDPLPTFYIVNVKPTSFDYEVITDAMAATSHADSIRLGKMHFVSPGYMAAGTVINDIAGISIQFGTSGDQDWTLLKADSTRYPDEGGSIKGRGKVYTEGAPVELNDNEIPVGGTFAILRPTVNGFLTIDGRWAKDNLYKLIRVVDGEIVGEVDYIRTDSDHTNEQWMDQALVAGQTYYLFNYGASDGTYEPSQLHGFNFDPAYITSSDSHLPVEYSTTFVNGYTGTVAHMVTEPTANVSFQAEKVQGTKSGVSLSDYLTVDSQTGQVTPIKTTAGITESTATIKNRVIIRATVTNNDKTVTKLTDLYLYISDIPSYIIKDGETPSVGQRVSTTNIPTKITMTFGGWKNGSGPYLYRNKDLYDSWEPAKTDTVGQNQMTIDGFDFASQGANDARDENLNSYNGSSSNHTPWQLPCRGTYLTFEPEENGTLIVYLLQNGVIDYTGSRQWDDLEEGYTMKYRPLFILDEAAHNVQLDNSWVMDASLLPSNSRQDTHAGSYTEGLYRSTWDDSWVKQQLASHNRNTFTNPNGYDDCPYDLFTNYKNRTDELDSIMTQWKKYRNYDDTEHARQEIVHLPSGGYTLISKAFVRYTFQVKAGKTYYIFMRGSKLSPCGFSFVPTGWEPDRSTTQTVHEMTLNDTEDFETTFNNLDGNDVTSDGELRNANVTLNRKFGRNKWTSICLPFSMSETKFKTFFGDAASIITYDSIGHDGTGYFSQHVVHSIVANRPYFICPSQDVESGSIINNVTVENDYEAMTVNDNHGEYAAIGTFAPVTVPASSYIFAGTDIYHLKSSEDLNGYRAYIKPLTASAKPMLSISVANIDPTKPLSPTTGIASIIFGNSSMLNAQSGVYNLQGEKVSENLSPSLRPGVYIVNGIKVLVRP